MPSAFAEARDKARLAAGLDRGISADKAKARIGSAVGRAEAALREPLRDKAIRLAGGEFMIGKKIKRGAKASGSFFKRAGTAITKVNAKLNKASRKFDRTARGFDRQEVSIKAKPKKALGGSLGDAIFK